MTAPTTPDFQAIAQEIVTEQSGAHLDCEETRFCFEATCPAHLARAIATAIEDAYAAGLSKAERSDPTLLADVVDLHRQATTEHSHFYTANVLARCIRALGREGPA